jgi:alpha-methylacyl-CoA racemase
MGPLEGIRVVELAGIGPAPFSCMLLADMGAEVIRVDRLEATNQSAFTVDPKIYVSARGRRSIAVDLKHPAGIAVVKRLVAHADALVEGFRPGVTERLGLGPESCLELNPRLVYGRMTGWGQEGPLAQTAAHDLNYIALAGALHAIGEAGGGPVSPLNLVGDFGGGAMYLAFGMVCALLEAKRSGQGQVVDAAIVDGVASLMTPIFTQMAAGTWRDERGANLADGSRPWYAVYQTLDGKYISIAAIEDRFYANLIQRIGLKDSGLPPQHDASRWPELRARLAAIFRSRTRDEWCALLEGTETCFAPVLSPAEAGNHPHNRIRATFVERDGIVQPAPAPRFSRSVPELGLPPPTPGQHTPEVLRAWGFSDMEISELQKISAVR